MQHDDETDAHPPSDEAGATAEGAPTTPGQTSDSDELPVKVCPHCSVQSQTDGQYCPHCGASYVHGRKGLAKRTKVIVAAVLGALVLAGAGVAIAQKVSHDNQVAEEKRQAEAAAKAAAAQRKQEELAAQKEEEAQAERDRIERSIRASAVRGMRKSITKDAKERVTEGILDGPIYGTQCDPVGGGSQDNLEAKTTKFECLAIHKKNGDGTVEGWRFSATMNWDDGSYTWRLGSG